jgi:hypothetical protein
METKKKGTTAVVTEGSAQAALRRGPARELTPEEERVMRMRLGAAPPRGAPLERSAEGLSDLEIEVLSYEIEAYMRWREHQGRATETAPARPPSGTAPSRAKEKIIRALRKKGL